VIRSAALCLSPLLMSGIVACGAATGEDGSPLAEDGLLSAEGDVVFEEPGMSHMEEQIDEEPGQLVASEDDPVGTVRSAHNILSTRVFMRSQQLSVNHTVTGANAFNSKNGAISVIRESLGKYLVTFENVATNHGTPHVVAFGNTNARCQLGGLQLTSTGMVMSVRCFTPAGALTDSLFRASYEDTPWTSRNDTAFGVCVSPATSHFSPIEISMNPKGSGLVEIFRAGTGRYTMIFDGLNSQQGTVLVTPMGTDPRTCQVTTWSNISGNTRVSVACHSPGGALADSMFTLLYMGRQSTSDMPGQNGFLRATDLVTAEYSPPRDFSWNTAVESDLVNTAGNLSSSQFARFPSFDTASTRKTTAFVTASAASTKQIACRPLSWTTSQVNVRCTDAAGATVKSQHMAWLLNQEP
jgi:hypothetical protein